MTTTCSRCDEKPRHGAKSWCKPCLNEYSRTYYAANRERLLQQMRERNPEGRWAYNIKRWYGLEVAEYEEMLDRQNGRCAICGGTNPGGKRIKRMSVDHDHMTGQVRGLLCQPCNQLVGLAGDNPQTLLAAAIYLGAKL